MRWSRRTSCWLRRWPPRANSASTLPAAYAATKKQLHKPVRVAIDAGTDATDENVRASWVSEETRGRVNGFLESLARGR